MNTFDRIVSGGVIAILRGIPKDKLIPLAEAITKGGVKNIEITLVHTNEETIKGSLEKINMLANSGLDIFVGAGTVLTAEQVHLAKDAGANYIISPDAKESVIKETKKLGLLSMPGALTPSEIAMAYDWGGDIIKVFPANAMGPDYLKAVKAPLKHVPVAAVGGVNISNVQKYIDAGACCIGVGGVLANYNDLESVTEAAFALSEAMRTGR